MAIIIPSKNIFQIDNEKVRANVIERVEVNATAIAPDNAYETPVYNGVLDLKSNTEEVPTNNVGGNAYDYLSTPLPVSVSGNYIIDKYLQIDIRIPKLQDNSYVSKIYTENRTQVSKNINSCIYLYEEAQGVIATNYDVSRPNENISFNIDKIVKTEYAKELLKEEKNIGQLKNYLVRHIGKLTLSNNATNWNKPVPENDDTYNIWTISNIKYDQIGSNAAGNITSAATLTADIIESLGDPEYEEDDTAYIIKNVRIFVGRTIYSWATAFFAGARVVGGMYPAQIVEIQQNVEKAEITVYGNTISIDLNELKQTIGNADSTNLYSVSNNELIQTANYYGEGEVYIPKEIDITVVKKVGSLGSTFNYEIISVEPLIKDDILQYQGTEATVNTVESANNTYHIRFNRTSPTINPWEEAVGSDITVNKYGNYTTGENYGEYISNNAIELFSKKILSQYKNGKETATLVCSINNYYDDQKQIAISVDNGELPMTFKLYDEVIPYIPSASGKDIPMSTYSDGKPKVFRVLQSNIYQQGGAPKQRIDIQEI